MTFASWFSSMRHCRRRVSPTGAHRNRSSASHRRASFEALEDRRLLSTVNFVTDSETFDAPGAGLFLPVALSGNVSTIGFDWPGPAGLAFDPAGNLYVNESDAAGTVSKVTPSGTISKLASGFQQDLHAGALAIDPFGNVFVANPGAGAVNVVTREGVISTWATGLTDAWGLAIDSADNLYVSEPTNSTVSKVTPQGKVEPFASGLDGPLGLALHAGNLYVANQTAGTVVELSSTARVVDTISGV